MAYDNLDEDVNKWVNYDCTEIIIPSNYFSSSPSEDSMEIAATSSEYPLGLTFDSASDSNSNSAFYYHAFTTQEDVQNLTAMESSQNTTESSQNSTAMDPISSASRIARSHSLARSSSSTSISSTKSRNEPSTRSSSPHPLARSSSSNSIGKRGSTNSIKKIKSQEDSQYVDITPYLRMSQHEAAKCLGIPSSTLSKRWKEAAMNRKWPYRVLSKLEKEILTLMQNSENCSTPQIAESMQSTLDDLNRKREEEMRPVLIRM